MTGDIINRILPILYSIPGILGALTIHEFSHALMSTWLGDPLPKARGRLSLNPFHHMDPFGAIMLLLVGFGWAKPVYVDPRHYKKPRLGMALVALAGPVSNLLTAFVLFAIFLCIPMTSVQNKILGIAYQMLYYGIMINIGLALFNLIPVPPLDGSKVLFSFLPPKAYDKFLRFEQYGFILLIILLFDIPGRILSVIGLPVTVTMWFNLTTYLSIAQSSILDAFFKVIWPVLELFN